jgi:hypothetical protein
MFSDEPLFTHAYLTGARGPQLSSRGGFNVLGVEFRVVLHFGVLLFDALEDNRETVLLELGPGEGDPD